MPDQIKLKKYFIFIAVLSWALLVGNTLLYRSQNETIPAETTFSWYLTYIFKTIFVLAVFLFQRLRVNDYKGIDFMGYLWKLFFGPA